jgi:hypothetical protein
MGIHGFLLLRGIVLPEGSCRPGHFLANSPLLAIIDQKTGSVVFKIAQIEGINMADGMIRLRIKIRR